MVRTLHLPPADQDGRYGPDFIHGIDLERVHERSGQPQRRWLVAAALVLTATVIAVVVLLTVAVQSVPDGPHDSGIAQAIQAREAEFERSHDSGIALWLREQ
jgi:hypothetical protein